MKEMFTLKGKVALITGGARGLGYQIAETYAEAGANVIVCSRDGEACEKAAVQLANDYHVTTLGVRCDVTDEQEVEHVVRQVVEQFGTIDILVNNSGASWAAPIEQTPLQGWQKVMDVNVTGAFLMCRAVGHVMLQNKSGKVINIASIAGFGGTPPFMQTLSYNTSKGALMTFTKDLAVKWGASGICVNALAPGFFPTKMSKVLIEHGGDEIRKSTPLGRLGSDSDLKGPALFLASEASDYVTGVILPVDGGASAL